MVIYLFVSYIGLPPGEGGAHGPPFQISSNFGGMTPFHLEIDP